jgi:hypothetical protein
MKLRLGRCWCDGCLKQRYQVDRPLWWLTAYGSGRSFVGDLKVIAYGRHLWRREVAS